MVKFIKLKNRGGPGPSSSLGLLSFKETSKSMIKLTPELVITISLLFGLIVLVLSLI